jgi:type VI secretion system protein ImpC
MTVDITFGQSLRHRTSSESQSRDTIFRIAVIGDFSGKRNRAIRQSADELAAIKPIQIDRDNLDDRLSSLDVKLDHLLATRENESESLSIAFSAIEDFDPDRLFERLSIFSKLRRLRRRVQDPDTVNAACAELGELMGFPSDRDVQSGNSGKTESTNLPGPEGLLDQMLEGSTVNESGNTQQAPFDLARLIRPIVARHAVPRADSRQSDILKSLDASISLTMLALLRHPAFRQLEAGWRGMDFLVRRLETGTKLKLYLIDVSHEEFQADLLASEDLTQTGIYRLLVEQTVETPGGQPWSLLVGNYYWGNRPEDISALGRMAKVAARAGAPFITSSDGRIMGCPQPTHAPDPQAWTPADSEAWQRLRALPESGNLAMLWPGFLLRLPYGRSSRPTEKFDLEEVGYSNRQYLLWGNPALLAALAIGQDFSRVGWDFRFGSSRQVSDLPVWVFENQGEMEAHPCTQLLISQRGRDLIESLGIVPVMAVKDQDAINIPGLHSIAGSILVK